MERGGCHYLFNENDSSGSGSSCGVRLVWRRVTGENVMVYLGMYGMWPKGVFLFIAIESLRCPQRFERQRVPKVQPQLARTCASTPRLQTKIVLARPSSDMAAHIIGSIGGTQADSVPIKRALLSVSDKTGLVELGKALAAKNVELLSTGGTAKALRAAGLQVQGRRRLHGLPRDAGGPREDAPPQGARRHHVRARQRRARLLDGDGVVVGEGGGHQGHRSGGVEFICLRSDTVAKGSDFETCVENVEPPSRDRIGPSMLRSSAKNHRYVTIATAPSQYAELISALNKDGCTPYSLRKKFAAAAIKGIDLRHLCSLRRDDRLVVRGPIRSQRTGRGTHSTDAVRVNSRDR